MARSSITCSRSFVQSRLLVESESEARGGDGDSETPLDVFYWQFGDSTRRATERLNRARVVLVGVNSVSRQIAQTLVASGVTNVTAIDDPRLRNASLLAHTGGWPEAVPRVADPDSWRVQAFDPAPCVVGTCDFGNQQAIAEWNLFCVDRGFHFLPAFLQNSVGYVGPLVVPGETACFDCVRSRWNAQIDPAENRRAVDGVTLEGESVVGFHPAMASVLGNVAAFELTKYYARTLPNPRVGTQIELSLLVPRLTTRSILKVPRCRTCSPLRDVQRPVSAGT